MRPVVRGDWPQDENGNNIQYTDYGNAKRELINRLGEYCSYCEMPIKNAPAVEHIQPKTLVPEKEKDWNNFLLACTYCNSTKGQKEIDLDKYLWPDKNNTFMAFKYSEGGLVSVAENLNNDVTEKANSTIALTGLDKIPNNDIAADNRLRYRDECWEIAKNLKNDLANCNDLIFRECMAKFAKSVGFWSIWMTVFRDDFDMLERFIEAFPGTCKICFDKENGYSPVFRNGDQI